MNKDEVQELIEKSIQEKEYQEQQARSHKAYIKNLQATALSIKEEIADLTAKRDRVSIEVKDFDRIYKNRQTQSQEELAELKENQKIEIDKCKEDTLLKCNEVREEISHGNAILNSINTKISIAEINYTQIQTAAKALEQEVSDLGKRKVELNKELDDLYAKEFAVKQNIALLKQDRDKKQEEFDKIELDKKGLEERTKAAEKATARADENILILSSLQKEKANFDAYVIETKNLLSSKEFAANAKESKYTALVAEMEQTKRLFNVKLKAVEKREEDVQRERIKLRDLKNDLGL
jgi:chromosome segregation ATPase